MDSFIEYMIEQKRSPVIKFKKALIYLAAIFVSMIISFILMVISFQTVSMVPITILGILYGAYYINCSFNVEFEYILTNGELDIDKITNKKRRKRLITIHCKSFTEFEKYNSKENSNEDKKEFSRIINASANSKTYNDYYAVFYKNGQKIKLIFTPTQKMIEAFKIYAPRAVKEDLLVTND